LIFVDSTVWIGDADLNDDLHNSSHAILEAVRMGRLPFALTTDFVIDEVVTILGYRRGFGGQKAKTVGESILQSPRVFTVFVDEEILRTALTRYPMFEGKLSLTDVVSIILVEKYGVKQVYSHDTDFDQVQGIERLEAP